MPEDELKIAQDALGAKISATASGSLLKNRTGIDLNWHQLQHLKTKDKNNNTSDGKNSAHATATDRLLADLKADPEVSFVCLFGDVSSGLLTIKTKRKNVNNSLADELFLDDLGDSTDSPQDFARDMTGKENLIHTDSGQMLLAIAWTNNKARRKFDMYPEFMGGDDTEDTAILRSVLCIHSWAKITTTCHLDILGASCRQRHYGCLDGSLSMLCPNCIPALPPRG